MKRLSTSIFRNCMLVSSLASLAVVVLFMAVFYHDYSAEYVNNLKNEAEVLKSIADYGGEAEIVKVESDHRITLIASDGYVLLDNIANSAEMDNHNDREEFLKANESGVGIAERESDVLGKKAVYVAVKLDNGSVLRVSDVKPTVFDLIGDTWWVMLLIFLIETLISFFVASKISKKVTAPINEIDLEDPDSTEIYEELSPLLTKIGDQNSQIAKQLHNIRAEHDNQDAMRRDFTANVSHELKTPLTSISGYAEIIKTGIAKQEDVERFAGKIYDESQRLVTLVGDIIKLSQLDGKDIQVEYSNVDLFKLCESIVLQLELSAAKKNVTFNLQGEAVQLYTASKVVEEIIFNICDNAVKYNKSGGSVNITIRQCVDGVELSVADTGIGIPEDEVDRVFERFYRVDKSHSKEIGGTGLGLSIVKHGVRFLDASLSVESQLDKGTVIRIVF